MLIRAAQPDDALPVAEVHVRSWQAAYKGLLPDGYLDSLDIRQRAARYDFANSDLAKPKTFLALVNDVVAGFATISPATDSDQVECGELSALYVHPDHWHRGVGARLLAHAEQQLAARGYQRAVLWVLQGNNRAEQFYRAQGWTIDGRHRRMEVWNVMIDETGYQRMLNPNAL